MLLNERLTALAGRGLERRPLRAARRPTRGNSEERVNMRPVSSFLLPTTNSFRISMPPSRCSPTSSGPVIFRKMEDLTMPSDLQEYLHSFLWLFQHQQDMHLVSQRLGIGGIYFQSLVVSLLCLYILSIGLQNYSLG